MWEEEQDLLLLDPRVAPPDVHLATWVQAAGLDIVIVNLEISLTFSEPLFPRREMGQERYE